MTTLKGAPGGEIAGETWRAKDSYETRRAMLMPKINDMIRHGDEDGASKLMDSLDMTPKEQNRHINSILNPTVTPRQFNQTYKRATPEQQRRMDAARDRAP